MGKKVKEVLQLRSQVVPWQVVNSFVKVTPSSPKDKKEMWLASQQNLADHEGSG